MRPLRLFIYWQALLLCYMCVAAPAAFAGLLLDPSFEVPKTSGSPWYFSDSANNPVTWEGHSAYPKAYSGTHPLQLETDTKIVGSMSYVKQSLAAIGLQEWTFSGHMLNYGDSRMKESYSYLEIVFSGSFGEKRSSSSLFRPQESGPPGSWSLGSVTATAPLGSEQVTFYVKHVQEFEIRDGVSVIWWDAMDATVLEPVPELASTGWVAVLVIGLAIGGRRLGNRRSAQPKAPDLL